MTAFLRIIDSARIALFLGAITSVIFIVHAGPPDNGPDGVPPGGRFSIYFQNMISGNAPSIGTCPTGQVIVGFYTGNTSDYGKPICQTVSAYWTLSGSQLFYTTGSIGVGTTNPGASLHVVGGQILSTTGSTTNSRSLTLLQNGNSQITYGAYPGSWRSSIQLQSNDNQRLLFLVPPEADSPNSIIRSANGGIRFDVGGTVGDTGISAVTINSSGNVGIGTQSPGYALEVAGTGSFLGIRILSGASAGYFLTSDASGNAYWGMPTGFESALSLSGNLRGSANLLAKYTGTGASIGNSQIYDDGTNVGIGTTSPGAKLDIASSQASGIRFRYDTFDNYRASIVPYWNSSTDTRMDFNIERISGGGLSTIMSVGYAGNVGIGTTSPVSKLEVSGTSDNGLKVTASGETSQVYLHVAGGDYGYLSLGGSGNLETALRGSGQISSFGGNVGIGIASPSATLDVNGTARLSGDHAGSNRVEFVNTNGSGGHQWELYPTVNYFSLYNRTAAIQPLTVLNNGNVGISTSAPAGALDISGSLLQRSSVGAGAWIGADSSGANRSFLVLDKDSADGIGSGADYVYLAQEDTRGVLTSALGTSFDLGSNQAVHMTIGTSGNVGIGTTTPVEKLQVAGSIVLNNNHNLSWGGSYGGGIPTIASNIGDGIYFYPVGSTLGATMKINSSGNVGIGTTSPSAKLDVVGGLARANGYTLAEAGSDNLLINGGFEMGGTYGWTGLGGVYNVLTGAVSGRYVAYASGAVQIESADMIPVNPTRDVLQIEGYFKKSVAGVSQGSLYFGYIAYDANLTPITTSPCGTYCYFAASAYILPADGNWYKFSATTRGEGTSFPNFPVGTKFVRVMAILNYAASADAVTQVDHISVKRINNGPLFVGNDFSSTNDVNYAQSKIYTTPANNLIFEPNSSGNVGIGTTSPSAKLSINDGGANIPNLSLVKTLGGSNNLTIGNTFVGGSTFALNAGITGVDNGGLEIRDTDAGVARMVIQKTSGNVGIGTTSPSYKLDVNGDINLSINSALRHAGVWTLGATAGEVSIGSTATSKNIGLYTNGLTPAIFANTSGNVGIGTTSPTQKLDINGSVRVSGGFYRPDNAGLAMSLTNGLNYFYGNHEFRNALGSTVNLLIQDGGNVGIGTTSPGAKLDVNGTIRQGSILARPLATWSAGGDTYGAVIIKLPGTTGNYGMLHIEVDTYEYNSVGATKYIIGGHNWNGQWHNTSVQTIGKAAKSVRLGFKDGQYAIILGGPGVYWSYGHVVLSKITTGGYYAGVMDLGGTYTITQDNSADSYTWITGDLNGTSFDRLTVANTINGNISGSAGSASEANRLYYTDNRTVAPNSAAGNRMNFGFTSWNNNNAAPYADFIHMRSYADSSGGNDNLLVFRKDTIGARLFQQSYNSATPYSSYRDFVMTDANSTNVSIGGVLTANTLALPNGFQIQQGGSNYGSFNSWVYLNGYYGFYSSYNGAHLFPNDGSYGSWKINGSRGGWAGLEFQATGGGVGNVNLMMNNDNVGFHNTANGWMFRTYGGNAYVSAGSSGGGTEKLIIDSGNIGSQNVSTANSVNHLGRISAEINHDTYKAGVYTYGTYTSTNNGGNPPFSYAEVLGWGEGGAGTIQIAGDWVSSSDTPLAVRSLRDCCSNWSSWNRIYTDTYRPYSDSATRLYASDAPYRYGDASSYYMNMTYDGSRWLLQASPATPAAIRVAYSDATGNATNLGGVAASSYARRDENNNFTGYIRAGTNVYTDTNYGYGLVGLYDSTRYQGVFAMGDAYKLAPDGTSPGSLYGIAWTHSNVGGQSIAGLGHQALFMANGITQTAIGNGIWTRENITAGGTIQGINLDMNRDSSARNGISWYSPTYTAWSDYMSPAGQVNTGPNANITAPTGSLVTSWGLRSFIENAGGYGWTWESGTSTGQPTVVAEIRASDGSARFAGSVYSNNFYYNSDRSLKRDIEPIVSPLEKILSLSGYTFTWKSTGRRDMGVIAQEVEKIFPDIVGESRTASGDTIKTVEYGNLVAPLIEAVKEQQREIKKQDDKIRLLEAKIDLLLQKQ